MLPYPVSSRPNSKISSIKVSRENALRGSLAVVAVGSGSSPSTPQLCSQPLLRTQHAKDGSQPLGLRLQRAGGAEVNRVHQHSASQIPGELKKKQQTGPQIHELETGVGSQESPVCNAGGGAAVLMRPEGLRKGKSPGVSLASDMGRQRQSSSPELLSWPGLP